jgi:hypothetical protein
LRLSLPNKLPFGGGSDHLPRVRRRGAAVPPGVKRSRSSKPSATRFDLRNTWQVVAGAILIPLGVAAIMMAWYGAAHARVDQQQIPYLISGGLLGLGAIIAGALLYWSHWLYRIYDQADVQHQEFMRSQAEIRDALLSVGARSAPGAGHRPSDHMIDVTTGAGARGTRPNGADFVATASGTNFHRPDCPIVARHPRGLRAISEKAARKLAPCRICEPLVPQA